MKSYFIDEKDRKAAPIWEYIATPKKLQWLEKLLKTELSQLNNTAELHNALNILRATPLVSSSLVTSCYQMKEDTKRTVQEVHVLVAAANFNAALQSGQLHIDPKSVKTSLEQGSNVIKAMRTWNKVWNQTYANGENPLFPLFGVPRHQFLSKGIRSGTIRVEDFVPRNDFASAESFALFACIETNNGLQEGYLNTPGNLVPLSQAKLYDSLTSAETAMTRSGAVSQYEEVQIVRLNLSVSAIENVVTSSKSVHNSRLSESCIHHVAADVQKLAIESALQQASDEQLRQHWQDRITPSVKRKM